MNGEESFRAYVGARLAALSRVAYLLTGDRHLAEDLVQSALLKVAGHWERVVASGDPEAYVRRVLYHQHVSWWRRRLVAVSYADAPDRALPDGTVQLDTSIIVRRELSQLTPRQRAALVRAAAAPPP